MIELTDPVALTQALVRCPSITPEDAGALDVVEGALARLGFRCHRLTFETPGTVPVANLYARLGSAGPHIAFAGHTDVVPPGDVAAWHAAPFAAEIVDGHVHGRGAVDMKGAIACFVAAVARLGGERRAGSISCLITGDEEGPAVNGTQKLLAWMREQGELPDACLVGEPTNPEHLGETIKIGRRGSMTGHLTVRGVQGHVAYPERADNPIPRLLRLLDALTREPLDAGSAHFQPSGLVITTVDVGNPASNVIPAAARATFNIRFNDCHTPASLEARLRAQLGRARGSLRPRHQHQRRGLRDHARAAHRAARRRHPGRDRPYARALDLGRHLRCEVHQGRVPGRRVRPGRPDHAPGRRAGRGRPTSRR